MTIKQLHSFAPLRWLTLAACCLPLACCGDQPTLDPPDVRWGQDVCAECGMILSDDRYAAAVVTIHDGQRHVHLYDDAGEMLAHPPDARGAVRFWVRDVSTRQWIDAVAAHYVRSRDLHTPMGYGVAALADLEQARKLRDQTDGQLLTYADLAAIRGSDPSGPAAAPEAHAPNTGETP